MIWHGYVRAIDGGHIRTVVLKTSDAHSTELVKRELRHKMLPVMGTEGDDWELIRLTNLTNDFGTLLVVETVEGFK